MLSHNLLKHFSRFGDFYKLKIKKVIIGIRFCYVELSDGRFGIASTVSNSESSSHYRYFGNFSPNNICGNKICELFEKDWQNEYLNSIRIAALNAFSSKFFISEKYKILNNTDPIDLIDFSNKKNVIMVGAFISYLKFFKDNNVDIRLLEQNKETIPKEYIKYYIESQEKNNYLAKGDIIIITGLTLVNNTFDELITNISPSAKIILTGPTANLDPDFLFSNRIDIIGATRFYDRKTTERLVSEAASGYHFFKYCAEKITIKNNSLAS